MLKLSRVFKNLRGLLEKIPRKPILKYKPINILTSSVGIGFVLWLTNKKILMESVNLDEEKNEYNIYEIDDNLS
jgi:hypothetical protein